MSKDAEVREGHPRQKANHEQPHEGTKEVWGMLGPTGSTGPLKQEDSYS